jgi:hypothetical protein
MAYLYVHSIYDDISSDEEDEENREIDYPSTEESDTETPNQSRSESFEEYERILRCYHKNTTENETDMIFPTITVSVQLCKFNTDCSVCLCVLDYSIKSVCCSKCGQSFHVECIKKLYFHAQSKKTVRCPMCRVILQISETPKCPN